MKRIRMLSDRPAAKPASAPIVAPTTTAKPIAAKPTVSDVRAPWTTRLNTSRKLPSVPKMCSGLSAGHPSRWTHGGDRRSGFSSTPSSD